ncbi:hypothetical protein [Parasphingorhabdus sp.]|uniref:hypothetical protein n=1 Tax=Parasphingorhabdus sp. TaxID=2709688 RepID=UPI00300391C6
MHKKLIAGLALSGLAQSVSAQTAPPPKCLSIAQAEALVTYLLPSAVQASRDKCSASLPATAPLLKENSEQLAKYRAAAEGAWPQAKSAVTVMAGEKLPAGIDDTLLRPITDAMFTSLISEEIKPKDCNLIAKIYHDLEPMPSSNLASLAISIVQAASKDDKKQDIPICKAPA